MKNIFKVTRNVATSVSNTLKNRAIVEYRTFKECNNAQRAYMLAEYASVYAMKNASIGKAAVVALPTAFVAGLGMEVELENIRVAQAAKLMEEQK